MMKKIVCLVLVGMLSIPGLVLGQTFTKEGKVWVGAGPLGPPLVYDNVSPLEDYLDRQRRAEEAKKVIRQHMKEWQEVERVKNLPPNDPRRQAWEKSFVDNNPAWEFVPRNQWPDK